MVKTDKSKDIVLIPHYNHPQQLYILAAVAVLLMVLVGWLSFVAGEHHQKSRTVSVAANNPGAGQFGGGLGGGLGSPRRGGSIGTVSSISANSITVQDRRSGMDSSFNLDSSTTVTNNGQVATVSDIKPGDLVLIRTSSADNKTAASIMLNPSFGGGPAAGQLPAPAQTQTN